MTAAPGTMRIRPKSGRVPMWTVTMRPLPSEQRVRDTDHARAEDDHKERWEDAQDQWESDLHRYLLRLSLGPLTAAYPHLLRLLAQHPGDRNTEVARLDQGRDKGPRLGHRGPIGQRAERLAAGLADLHLLERSRELGGQWPVGVAGDLSERGVKAEPGLDADGKHVQRVRQRHLNFGLPLLARVVEQDVGQEKP